MMTKMAILMMFMGEIFIIIIIGFMFQVRTIATEPIVPEVL